jgi:prepilin-type N-terminal cleavage/methylation domain-containing protein
MIYKGFSLLELIITTVVLSILITVLFQSYSYISTTAIRLQTVATLQKEMLQVIQVLQNDVDNGSIVWSLTGKVVWDETLEVITQSWSRISYYRQCDTQQKCGIIRDTGDRVLLTDPEKISVTTFSIGHISQASAQWFWLRSSFAYSKNLRISQQFQTFFSNR